MAVSAAPGLRFTLGSPTNESMGTGKSKGSRSRRGGSLFFNDHRRNQRATGKEMRAGVEPEDEDQGTREATKNSRRNGGSNDRGSRATALQYMQYMQYMEGNWLNLGRYGTVCTLLSPRGL